MITISLTITFWGVQECWGRGEMANIEKRANNLALAVNSITAKQSHLEIMLKPHPRRKYLFLGQLFLCSLLTVQTSHVQDG